MNAIVKYKKSPVTINCSGKLVVDESILKTDGIIREIEASRKLKEMLTQKRRITKISIN